MPNKNDRLVVGYYANKNAAEAAAKAIKEWDEWDAKDIKLGAIAVLTMDPKSGKLHADEVGERSTKSGALWGTAIGATLGILTAGIALIPGMIVGAAAGGGLGALNHKSVGMSDADRDALVDNLRHGGAALAIMCDDYEVPAVKAKMVDEGGNVEAYAVQDDVAAAVTSAAEAQASAAEAIDEAVDEMEEVVTGVPAEVSKVAAVAGVSAAEATRYHDAGVAKASDLLAKASTAQGRDELAAATGVSSDAILVQAKRLDLMRLKGVGVKYANLLLASGVDTVPELSARNAANLTAKMAEVNAVENIVRDLPTEAMTSDWIAEAKVLPRMIYY